MPTLALGSMTKPGVGVCSKDWGRGLCGAGPGPKEASGRVSAPRGPGLTGKYSPTRGALYPEAGGRWGPTEGSVSGQGTQEDPRGPLEALLGRREELPKERSSIFKEGKELAS